MAVTVMKRYEMKYLLDAAQADFLRRKLEGHMREDGYGLTTIASLYYDTPDARLIRASLEGTAFKEKIRVRSYGPATDSSPVFAELKRKYDGVVYKRRVQSTLPAVARFFAGEDLEEGDSQIRRELSWFRDFYGALAPACLVAYDRTAYFEPGGDLRLTIDERPRYRVEDLTLKGPAYGTPLLEEGRSILEIKVQGAMPLWLTAILSEGEIRRSSFSKYGEAYRRELAGPKEKPAAYAVPELPAAA